MHSASRHVEFRGARIDLGEIEAMLSSHEGVSAGVVDVRTSEHGEKRLVGYVVSARTPPPSGDVLRQFMRNGLPNYMVPSAFVVLDSWPLTPDGKIDRGALPDPERRLMAILPAFAASADDDRDGPPAAPPARRWDYLVPIQRAGTQPPLFLIPGGGGGEDEFAVYARLARFVGSDVPFYGLQARGWDGQREMHARVEEMAADYVREIRAFQPHGPYRLAGECAGGIAAYEVARQLSAEGQTVEPLLLLDTMRPTTARYLGQRWRRITEAPRARWRDQFVHPFARHRQVLHELRPWQRPGYVLANGAKSLVALARALRHTLLPSHRRGAAVSRRQRARTSYTSGLLRYRAKPYTGRVTLITNEQWRRHDLARAWAGVVRGGIQSIYVPGSHLSYIREDAPMTAAHIRSCLETSASQKT